ncbi:MAG: family hydrolase [Herbinix sp.]|nr:family hydrolase [Herbinix sp.]
MIKNIVFDYGYVLAYPRTGNWFIPPKMKGILTKGDMFRMLLKYRRIKEAYRRSRIHLDENHLLFTEEEEIVQFHNFYSEFLSLMGVSKKLEMKAHALALDNVCNDNKVIFYDDSVNSIRLLKSDYKIYVLSDTWPSLQRVLKHAHILEHLEGLIMSCDYGICKDNIKLFYHAAAKLQIEPEESVFIDDSEGNLANAQRAGFLPILMDRRGRKKDSRFPIAHNMNEVIKIVQTYTDDHRTIE